MIIANQIVRQARTWLGTPFHHQGRLKNHGCDCLGLVIGIAKELGLKDKHGQLLVSHDEINYSREPDGNYFMAKLMQLLEEVPIIDAKLGDLALFTICDNPQHVALLTDYDETVGMIHCYAQVRKVVEHRLDDEWKQCLVKVFRYR